MRLWIIGNGFDLYHELKTKYLHFRDFICQQRTCRNEYGRNKDSTRECCQQCCKSCERADWLCPVRKFYAMPRSREWTNKELWREVEEACSIDFHKLLKDANLGEWENYPSYREPPSAKLIHGALDFAEAFTGEFFYRWVGSIESKLIDRKKEFFGKHPEMALGVRDDDLFITFNYTRTLQEFYGVSDKNICHIHGAYNDAQQKITSLDPVDSTRVGSVAHEHLVFGSSDATEQAFRTAIESVTGAVSKKERDHLLEKCVRLARHLCKGIKEEKLKNFLEDKSEFLQIDEIILAGHSLGPIDAPYFKCLTKKFGHKKWLFLCHNDSDKTRVLEFCKTFKLEGECVPWEHVRKSHFKG